MNWSARMWPQPPLLRSTIWICASLPFEVRTSQLAQSSASLSLPAVLRTTSPSTRRLTAVSSERILAGDVGEHEVVGEHVAPAAGARSTISMCACLPREILDVPGRPVERPGVVPVAVRTTCAVDDEVDRRLAVARARVVAAGDLEVEDSRGRCVNSGETIEPRVRSPLLRVAEERVDALLADAAVAAAVRRGAGEVAGRRPGCRSRDPRSRRAPSPAGGVPSPRGRIVRVRAAADEEVHVVAADREAAATSACPCEPSKSMEAVDQPAALEAGRPSAGRAARRAPARSRTPCRSSSRRRSRRPRSPRRRHRPAACTAPRCRRVKRVPSKSPTKYCAAEPPAIPPGLRLTTITHLVLLAVAVDGEREQVRALPDAAGRRWRGRSRSLASSPSGSASCRAGPCARRPSTTAITHLFSGAYQNTFGSRNSPEPMSSTGLPA